MAASETVLGEVHELLAQDFVNMLRNGITEIVKQGSGENATEVEVTRRPTAAERAVMVSFLKNNNVTSTPAEDSALAEMQALMAARRAKKPPILTDTLADMPAGMH